MKLSIEVSRDDAKPEQGPARVGWFLTEEKGAVLFDAPERVASRGANRAHAKSAARCPAVVQMESRYFLVRCPYDLHLGFGRDKDGKAVLINRAGTSSTIRGNKIAQVVTLVSEAEWRYADRPTIQLALPYCFIADEPIYLTQLAAFAHYRTDPLPGTIFGGRFPLHIWPRPLMWAFEWHQTGKDLVLRRGEPLFYVQFETHDPARAVQLVEAARTAELMGYMNELAAVTNYVNQTFSLFEAAERLRPAKLLSERIRD